MSMNRALKTTILPLFIPHEGCPHSCVFCNQHALTGLSRPLEPSDLPPLIRKHSCHHKQSGKNHGLMEIAFYGGSFTCLPPERQEAFLTHAAAAVNQGLAQGIRLSTRPDGISPAALDLLKKFGVGTVELGVQSMDDTVLRLSRRGHTARESRQAVQHLKQHGFRVGVQLMPGLPGADPGNDMRSVQEVINMEPHLARIYPALVIRGTELHEMYERGEYRPMELEETIPMAARMLLEFSRAGIQVIRLGLQHNLDLEGGALVAGPHHPALRHLVESYIYLRLAELGLKSVGAIHGEAVFTVTPGNQSNFRGQKNGNISILKAEFSLDSLELKIEPELGDNVIQLRWGNRRWTGKTTDLTL